MTIRSWWWCLLVVLGCAGRGQVPVQPPAPPARTVEDLAHALAPFERLDWSPRTPAERTLVPYARLQLKKARLTGKNRFSTGPAVPAATYVRQGFAALELSRGKQPFLATPGKLCERAYITSNDGTVQPYYLYLPANYDPKRPWPLLVFLHGYVPSISVLDPWILSAESYRTAEKYGFILLTPYGRRNTDFQGIGELDVYEAIREVRDLYAIDADRIHLTGVSMGGAGCYYIGLRRPGRYAAFSAMDAQSDMHKWWPRILPNWPRDRKDIPPFRRWLVEWDNPVDLVMNARDQHYFILHGERDPLVSVDQSRTMVRLAADLGISMKYYEVKGAGHYIYWEPKIFDMAWRWHRPFRRERSPRRISYKTFSLEYDRAFWCRIGTFEHWGKPATVDAEFNADGTTLTAKTTNIRVLLIDTATAPVHGHKTFTALVNGKEIPGRPTADGWVSLVLAPPLTKPSKGDWPPRKRHGLCGPVEEVFDTPFIVVQGTGGTEEQNRRIQANVDRWAEEWDKFGDGRPPVVMDGQVTEKLVARRSLVLFGTPKSNAVLGKIADKLPIGIGDQRYTLSGRTYEGDDLGLVMCYPNPLNPERYVLIYAGQLYGERCGINHKHDLLPDFIVFNTRHFNYDDTNQHEVAGFFGLDWKLHPELTWIRAKKAPR